MKELLYTCAICKYRIYDTDAYPCSECHPQPPMSKWEMDEDMEKYFESTEYE